MNLGNYSGVQSYDNIHDYAIILNVKGMMKNHHLAQAISDTSWGMFINVLEYKCDNLVKIDKWFVSSQSCYVCGYVNKDIKNLAVRELVCPECETKRNRDLNAARNIEREGLSKVRGCIMLATTLVVGVVSFLKILKIGINTFLSFG